MTKKKIFFIVIIVLLIVFALGVNKKRRAQESSSPTPTPVPQEWTSAENSTNPSGIPTDTPTTKTPAQPIVKIDCTTNNPKCPQLAISGDAPDNSKFHAIADPSMRRDPNTGTLWMAYSWPHVVQPQQRRLLSRPNIAVDIHLAQSNDNGNHWTYAGPLWQSHLIKNPVSGAENFTSYEVANIWPQNQNGKTVWYAIHLYYLAKPNSFIYSQLGGYSYFSLSMASSPTELANAPSQILGFGGTVKGLGPDVNLSSFHSDLANCTIWNEPALTMQGNTLYLAAQCLSASGSKLVPEKNFYAIF